ncbi:MAG: hypothetical protein IJ996_05430 [Clostridia bacterium]|nr:hypothetical protein [Clostridia bacterium]
MIILYILLIAYILAVNFYAFLLLKTLKTQETENELAIQSAQKTPTPVKSDKPIGKLLITGLLGGAITIYVCMFVMKYKRGDLLLMVLMPLLGVLNIYAWVLAFRSGFRFFLVG